MKKTEPFDYLNSNVKVDQKALAERFIRMHLDEVRRRTQLLAELRYDKRYIKKRIKQNLRWEFELLGLPEFYNQVDRVIDQCYRSPSPETPGSLNAEAAKFPEDPTTAAQ